MFLDIKGLKVRMRFNLGKSVEIESIDIVISQFKKMREVRRKLR